MTTEVTYDERGLVITVAQDRLTGQVLMAAWMNAEALARTLTTGRATFFSRSRGRLWEKGETSGHTLRVRSIHADCDADTLLLLVDPAGPACHTGRPTCFFREHSPEGGFVDRPAEAMAFLQMLEREIAERAQATARQSYTKSLLDGGPHRIGEKLREEAAELAVALSAESPERVANEAADLIYHLMVGLRLREVGLRTVIEVLAGRAGTSGHAEKAARAGRAPDD
jgi:phosphoribosyl-AMP cyclohydrolase / phosphoribosyl-ATP pyrophosphohydrolase